jgi:hypothetical protein
MARPNTAGPSFQYEVAGNSLGATQQQQQYDQTFEEYQQQNHMQGRHPHQQQQRPGSAVPAAHAALRGGPGSDASFSFGMGPGPAWQQQGQALSPPQQQRPGMPGAGPAVPPGAGPVDDESLTTAALGLLEDAIRDALRTNRSVSEGSRDKLMKMFK